ncbi:zf-TFIIB domain-containing protein [Myxococcota bacterium]|nr:zf-TFIIB domain-containing protein [Myxococcota bacterium]
MRCPHDGSTMGKRIYEADIEIDQCPDCMGIFLDTDELQEIQSTVEKNYDAKKLKRPDKAAAAFEVQRQLESKPIQCPNCEETMSKKEHGFTSQIVVDICPFCRGLWLDAGELEALEIFFEKQREAAPSMGRMGMLWMGVKNFFDRQG